MITIVRKDHRFKLYISVSTKFLTWDLATSEICRELRLCHVRTSRRLPAVEAGLRCGQGGRRGNKERNKEVHARQGNS